MMNNKNSTADNVIGYPTIILGIMKYSLCMAFIISGAFNSGETKFVFAIPFMFFLLWISKKIHWILASINLIIIVFLIMLGQKLQKTSVYYPIIDHNIILVKDAYMSRAYSEEYHEWSDYYYYYYYYYDPYYEINQEREKSNPNIYKEEGTGPSEVKIIPKGTIIKVDSAEQGSIFLWQSPKVHLYTKEGVFDVFQSSIELDVIKEQMIAEKPYYSPFLADLGELMNYPLFVIIFLPVFLIILFYRKIPK